MQCRLAVTECDCGAGIVLNALHVLPNLISTTTL